MNNQKILRLPAVLDLTGLSRSTIYVMLKNGNFPQSRVLNKRSVGWYENEILDWVASRNTSRRA